MLGLSTKTNANFPQVTYEVQPPSYTSLKLLTGPPIGAGGDTLWASQYATYDALSGRMQKYLEGLTALHSANMQAQGSRALGRPVRRDPITTEHPLVRTHPVTGWKSLFFNTGFVTKIVGVPRAESDAIISYLNEIIATTQELHVRYSWGKNDVALWDNRITVRYDPVDETQCMLTNDTRTILHPMGLPHIVVTRSGSLATLSVPSLTQQESLRRKNIVIATACHVSTRTGPACPTTMTKPDFH